MSKLMKTTCVVHAVLSGVLGLVLLTVPGRFLQMIGWGPVDPILSRILGAALLASPGATIAAGAARIMQPQSCLRRCSWLSPRCRVSAYCAISSLPAGL